VIDPTTVGTEPPTEVRRQRSPFFWETLAEVWQYRNLVWALTRRDFVARYKQTILGVAWAVIIPFLTVVVFTLFVQRFANVDTHGAPYPLWSFVGLLPWTFFSNAVTNGGTNLISNRSLLNKIYASRAIYPIAGILLAGVDLLISVGALGVLFVVYTYLPSHLFWVVPLVLLVNLIVVTAAVLFVSIVMVYVRDLRNALPVVVQLGLFATPVMYPFAQIPERYRVLYAAANPLGPVIDAYRRVLLFGEYPDWKLFGVGSASAVVMLIVSFSVFSRFERNIADIL
jgi:ABC-type polysaccharide/polyol phosphate export permease